MRTESITSAQNPKFKNLLLLQEKSKARREQGLFVVEGRRELEHCLEAGFKVRTLFVREDLLAELESLATAADCPVILLSPALYRNTKLNLKVNICGAGFSFCQSRTEGSDAAHR